jgi:hypothetical protein
MVFLLQFHFEEKCMATMREVILKTAKTEDATLNYRDMILTITKSLPGVDFAEMEQITPIRKAVREAKAEDGQDPKALLTEEGFKKLVSILTSFKGYVPIEENAQFVRDIKESKSVEVAAVQGA